MEPLFPHCVVGAIDDQRAVVGSRGGEAAQEVMRVARRPGGSTQDTVIAEEGWVLLLVRPCVSPSMHIDVAQGVVGDEAPKTAGRTLVDLAIVLVCG